MADCADDMLELHSAVISYLPLQFFRYERCAAPAQDEMAAFDKPMMPTRIGVMLLKRASRRRICYGNDTSP